MCESRLSPVAFGYNVPAKEGYIRVCQQVSGCSVPTKVRCCIGIIIKFGILILEQWVQKETAKACVQIEEHWERGIHSLHRVDSSATIAK